MPSAEEQKYSPQQLKTKPVLPKITDRLLSGESMARGRRLVSKNAAFYLAFQTDGNLVAYWNSGNKAYWSPNLANRGGSIATMQTDGNFVVYAGKSALWSTGTAGHPTSFLVIQDDGNVVLYQGSRALWSSETPGGHTHDSGGFLGIHVDIIGPIEWLGHAASSAGRSLTHTLADGVKGFADLVGKVPIIGGPLHAVIGIAEGPFNLLNSIVQGERLDRALLASVKDQVSAIREVAPYAKMLLTSIPGLGVGIGVGLAMAEAAAAGRPIDQVLLAGVVGIIPGGVVGKAVFQFTQHAMAGDNLIRTAGNVGLAQLPPAARAALDTVAAAAKGDNIPKAALESAQKALPAEVQLALNAGIALGQGQKLQNIIAQGIQNAGTAELNNLASKGSDLIASQPLFKAASTIITSTEQSKGFKVGVALMSYTAVNETSVYQFRQKLSNDAKVGFDLAVSTQIGKIRSAVAPAKLPDAARAAFYTTKGMAKGAPAQKVAMMKVVAVHPVAREGAAVAISEMPHTWWQKLIAFLGL